MHKRTRRVYASSNPRIDRRRANLRNISLRRICGALLQRTIQSYVAIVHAVHAPLRENGERPAHCGSSGRQPVESATHRHLASFVLTVHARNRHRSIARLARISRKSQAAGNGWESANASAWAWYEGLRRTSVRIRAGKAAADSESARALRTVVAMPRERLCESVHS
jgi:hypothetical protein